MNPAFTKRKLLIFNDYFYPGYRGGGPIQSLTNFILTFENELDIYVVTGISDLYSTESYKDYIENAFNKVLLPGGKKTIQVFYAKPAELSKRKIHEIMDEIAPAVVYLNGVFSSRYFLFPLYVLKVVPVKIVVCPRGMLQKGALSVKPFKKKVYLTYLWLSGLLKKAYWHATNEEENNDIVRLFSINRGIIVAPNIPKLPVAKIAGLAKQAGELRLVYLSLIAEKKNLLLLLQMMAASDKNIRLDIYGPVTDNAYWSQCETLIKKMPEKILYRGDVQPKDVQSVIASYHALILLTKGENFGHALYESFSAGRPVITSNFTPWNGLYEIKAGLNLPIEDVLLCLKKIDLFVKMGQDEYDDFCLGAHWLSRKYYHQLDIEPYRKLFC